MKPVLEPAGQPRPPTAMAQDIGQSETDDQAQDTDHKYQEIFYWKYGRFETVRPPPFREISLQKALSETEKLLYEYKECIGFSNARNHDSINIVRQAQDAWYAAVPIFKGEEWTGYHYTTETDTRRILDVIRLFFEEVEWFGMLDFKWSRSSSAEAAWR